MNNAREYHSKLLTEFFIDNENLLLTPHTVAIYNLIESN